MLELVRNLRDLAVQFFSSEFLREVKLLAQGYPASKYPVVSCVAWSLSVILGEKIGMGMEVFDFI